MNIKKDIKIPKNKYIYQRYNGIIMKFIEDDNHYINVETGIATKKDSQILLGEISEKIVDLIQIGDFVNKGYVYEIGCTELGEKWIHTLNGLLLFEEDIKSILTHEQYEQNSYKLEGE